MARVYGNIQLGKVRLPEELACFLGLELSLFDVQSQRAAAASGVR